MPIDVGTPEPKYDPMTGEKLNQKPQEPPKKDYTMLWVLFSCIVGAFVPLLGMFLGLIFVLKRKFPEGFVVLFISFLAWMFWIAFG